MLKRLRLQLAFLYILAAVGLVALFGLGSYALLQLYFQRETDLALEYKMALQFRQYGLTPPAELLQAEQAWQAGNPRQPNSSTQVALVLPTTRPENTLTPSPTLTPSKPLETPTRLPPQAASEDENEDGGSESEDGESNRQPALPQITQTQVPSSQIALIQSTPSQSEGEDESPEDKYDAELASIYTLPIDASGKVISSPNQALPPFAQNQAASRAAQVNGHDLRTIRQADGTKLRLLTYRLSTASGPLILQMGRLLAEQERVLGQFLVGLAILGGLGIFFLGLGSWWLSGRSISPAQKAWDQQQTFISNASHELRTPLTLLRASAEVGLRGQPDDDQKAILQDILGETDYMSRLVDDLLLLSRLDARRLKLEYAQVSLPNLLQEIAGQAEKLMAGKNIHLQLGGTTGRVWGDRARLRQVLLILLDNAIRFTPAGGFIQLETAPHARTCRIMISDSGAGIAPEHLAHIFERFYQVVPSAEASRSNGLGLSIAKGIIEAQGGKISIESQVGKGTRVTIEMPAAA
jgi:signal transduction histidine kinase